MPYFWAQLFFAKSEIIHCAFFHSSEIKELRSLMGNISNCSLFGTCVRGSQDHPPIQWSLEGVSMCLCSWLTFINMWWYEMKSAKKNKKHGPSSGGNQIHSSFPVELYSMCLIFPSVRVTTCAWCLPGVSLEPTSLLSLVK